MTRLKLFVTVSVLALLAAACTGSTGPGGPGGTDRNVTTETLLLGTADGPLVVRVPTGSVLFDGPGAVSSLGGAWVLSSEASDGSTFLRRLEGSTGQVVSAATVPGELEARIVSESGRAVALTEPLPDGWDPFVPLPRARTTIVVADPIGQNETITLDLRGNFEPEAFSIDDERLFLLQHLPAETPTAYRVTVLDLATQKLLPVFGKFNGPAERMPGTRLSQLLGPDADQLYTLYTSSRAGYAPHDAPVASDAAVSFVHVLSLEDGWAHCVGLPRALWDRPANEQAMATTPDGSYLFVVDAGRGLVAAMHTETLEVRTAPLDLAFTGAIGRTSARISPDGQTLFVAIAGDDTSAATAGDDGSLVTALDASTFEVLDTWRLDESVTGLGVSADGDSLYVASELGISVLDTSTGDELVTVPIAGSSRITQVTPLAG
jgi:hypothetical protein